MTKPTKSPVRQAKTKISLDIRPIWSAWASALSDQRLRCPHEETLGPYLSIERTVKTLIRLGGYPGWSESSLGAHFILSCTDSFNLERGKLFPYFAMIYAA